MTSSIASYGEHAQSMRNARNAGLFFGVAFGAFNAWSNGWLPPGSMSDIVAALVSAIVAGGVFGLLLALFMRSRIIPRVEAMPLLSGETIEHSGLANHFLNLEGRGGRLALTRDRLVFKPHVANVQRSELAIPRSEIVSVAPVRTLGVVPNGIAVTLRSGKVERFVVNDRDTWIAKLAVK
jgi:hypothetical protein